MKPLTVYTYVNCATCRRAVKWLTVAGLAFEERPIRDQPPSPAELRAMLKAYDGELRRLFNTSGRDYREQQMGGKLPTMKESEAIALLAKNGNLVKRPFLLGEGVALVGFAEPVWSGALGRR